MDLRDGGVLLTKKDANRNSLQARLFVNRAGRRIFRRVFLKSAIYTGKPCKTSKGLRLNQSGAETAHPPPPPPALQAISVRMGELVVPGWAMDVELVVDFAGLSETPGSGQAPIQCRPPVCSAMGHHNFWWLCPRHRPPKHELLGQVRLSRWLGKINTK